jgi:hypothetical protein
LFSVIFNRLDRRVAALVRVGGLALIVLSVLRAEHPPAGHGRGLVIGVLLAASVIGWVCWTVRPGGERLTPDLWAMAVAGGLLCGASPDSAASAFVFVAVAAAGVRVDLSRAKWVPLAGGAALALGDIVYHHVGLGLLAYALGLAATLLAASNARQSAQRAEQAELLLAQPSARTRRRSAPPASKSRRASPARSTTSSPTRSPASPSSSRRRVL